ncbi:hypothetical protein BJF90_12055 [Pseudonocardia sp. CNS-004]|nr:hypothetical protein BJF90_12055 [Pseudonocardia sp. CNS-004]
MWPSSSRTAIAYGMECFPPKPLVGAVPSRRVAGSYVATSTDSTSAAATPCSATTAASASIGAWFHRLQACSLT